MRFAIQWAATQKIELTFFTMIDDLKPTRWSAAQVQSFEAAEVKRHLENLDKMVKKLFAESGRKPGKYQLATRFGYNAALSIRDYCAAEGDISYICISTRGAGGWARAFGTNTGSLITESMVPVIAVPSRWKRTPLRSVLYAADLKKYTKELEQVVNFAAPLKASIDVLHFSWPFENVEADSLKKLLGRKYRFGLEVDLRRNDAAKSLIQQLKEEIRRRKPSLVVMFTSQGRSFFQRIFLPSKAEQLSFDIQIPLLVFPKAKGE